jgi:hypothetical protein
MPMNRRLLRPTGGQAAPQTAPAMTTPVGQTLVTQSGQTLTTIQ